MIEIVKMIINQKIVISMIYLIITVTIISVKLRKKVLLFKHYTFCVYLDSIQINIDTRLIKYTVGKKQCLKVTLLKKNIIT